MSKENRVKRVRLQAYLASGIGSLAIVTHADAGVVEIDLTGRTGVNGGVASGDTGYLSPLTPGSNTTLSIFNNTYTFGGYLTGVTVYGYNENSGIFGGIAYSSGKPVRFGAGALIDATAGGGLFTGSNLTTFDNPNGTSTDFGPNSFLGFKDDLGRFGYIEVTWDSTTKTFQLISAAYESDPGVAIQTPSGAPIPEPASGAIAALLVGGSALRQWRKKRRESADLAV